jgi:vacuolar protein sorting-associated protein 16
VENHLRWQTQVGRYLVACFFRFTLKNLCAGLTGPPHSWSVIPPDFTISRHVEVILSVDATLYVVDNLESVDQRLSRGPFTHISVSPNGKSLALLTFSGLLLVVSTDFQRSLAELNTNNTMGAVGQVRQLQWCANDAVIVSWDNLVLLVGPFGDTLQSVRFYFVPFVILVTCFFFRYFYTGPTFAVTEIDGVRIVSPDVCDFIQKVPGV